ncbi:MAG TPA: PEMT/PEM2 methyltransferase family protein [Gemmatimonadales bacterium]|nr:PEMT/PEM2 methyltransferase family protein [Gemmatimonadales bacterium]
MLALGYHVASRLAYVVGVGVALSQQARHQRFTRHAGIAAGFRRFRRLAAVVMTNDALSFIALCLLTRDTLDSSVPQGALIALGLACIVLGAGTKLWAAASLGAGAYHWQDVFDPNAAPPGNPRGPYRLLRNPMYTVGYLHAYGFALVTSSWLGLLAAAFDQAAILVFHQLVEKPHFLRVAGRQVQRDA